jgi:hypothetical protein
MPAEDRKSVPTRSLCVIEGYIGLTGEFRRIRTPGGNRSSDTCTNDDVGAIYLERLPQTLHDLLANGGGHFTVRFFEKDGKFVTSDATDERRGHDLIHALAHE